VGKLRDPQRQPPDLPQFGGQRARARRKRLPGGIAVHRALDHDGHGCGPVDSTSTPKRVPRARTPKSGPMAAVVRASAGTGYVRLVVVPSSNTSVTTAVPSVSVGLAMST
jgi:hypothetical protein